jgi:hypothetical protein
MKASDEYRECFKHLITAIYLTAVGFLNLIRVIVASLAKVVSLHPKTSLSLFVMIIFVLCFVEQGRVAIAEQSNITDIYHRDSTIDSLKREIDLVKSRRPIVMHDTVRVVKYKIRRDTI